MTLTDREKIIIMITNFINLYSQNLQEKNIPQNQSVIDFILKSIPEKNKKILSIDLIDDIFAFVSTHMELS